MMGRGLAKKDERFTMTDSMSDEAIVQQTLDILAHEKEVLKKQLEAVTEKLISCEAERDRFFEQKRVSAGRYAEERALRQEYELALRKIKDISESFGSLNKISALAIEAIGTP